MEEISVEIEMIICRAAFKKQVLPKLLNPPGTRFSFQAPSLGSKVTSTDNHKPTRVKLILLQLATELHDCIIC